MASYVKTLKDSEGNQILPRTYAQAVIDSNGNTVEQRLATLDSKVSTVYKTKGSVQNYSDLPSNPEVGDVYNIINADSEHEIKAGDNVVWNGTEWDPLGGIVDISGKLDKVTSTADATRVYSIAANGTQGVIPTSYDPIASSLVRFDTGGTIHCGTPTANNHATNKGYVDNGLGGKLDKSTSHTTYNQLYGKNKYGNNGFYDFDKGVLADTIPQRDSNGQISVPNTPTAGSHATSKTYVDSKQPSTSSQTATTYSGAIDSNTTYKFSNPTTSITISGFTAVSGDNDPIWSIMFKAGANMVLSVPDTVKWDSGDEPSFEEGKTYNVMFKQGIGSEYIGRWGEF